MDSTYRQNKSPSAIALGDRFSLRTYVLASKASPNDSGIVIIVIIIVIGEARLVFHMGGIIAQRFYLGISIEQGNIIQTYQIPMGDMDVM